MSLRSKLKHKDYRVFELIMTIILKARLDQWVIQFTCELAFISIQSLIAQLISTF